MNRQLSFISKHGHLTARHLKVFVHGYLSATSERDRARMLAQIPAEGPDTDVVFACWNSGSLKEVLLYSGKSAMSSYVLPGKLKIAGALAYAIHGGIKHFSGIKERTREVGNLFFPELQDFTSQYPQLHSISLYGHSLGARVLLEALLAPTVSSLPRTRNLILMGGARNLESSELELILPAVDGRIFNFYSRNDRIVLGKPDSEKYIGRRPLPTCSMPDKIHNHMLEVGHSGYWEQLRYIFDLVDEDFASSLALTTSTS